MTARKRAKPAVPQEVEAKLREAFRRLPCDGSSPWSHEVLIEKYLYMIGPGVDEGAPSPSLLWKQLDRIGAGSQALLQALRSLQGPAIAALYARTGVQLGRLDGQLEGLLERVADGAKLAKDDLPPPGHGPHGPKPKDRARRVAAAAARDFNRLIFRAPTRITDGKCKGDFVIFLSGIFEALGIKASAERYAKEAIRDRRMDE